ncbi:PP2C family protein-serine/threonine phosphatase [Nocardioides nanhaiensis]|uniref:PP2C family protein-serine/threonine phosphatase n=1 Tax=Nocardioides nanhaiensis TaxID=1476871 RepID=A0ABP8WL49_9ACTN
MSAIRDSLRACGEFAAAGANSWRTGSRRGQVLMLTVLLAGVLVSFGVSLARYDWMPLTAYFVWLLLGVLLLRLWPLVALSAVTTAAAFTAVLWAGGGALEVRQMTAMVAFVIAVALILYQAAHQRSGLPVTLGEAMLSELRDRLQAQGVMPPLPQEWEAQSAVRSSQGLSYAGDFFVADLAEGPHGPRLEMVLVDVCGKGVAVGPQALQFAGALGGLLGSLPPHELFDAANRFLLRQHSDESFATAVHLVVDLDPGTYTVTSAGHPPALRWASLDRRWEVDNARGMALGILPDPELHSSEGVLGPGDALMFYTDGVIETRDADLDAGISWLQGTARRAVRTGFDGAARRIIRQVPGGDDDRAVLILSRGLPAAVASPVVIDAPGARAAQAPAVAGEAPRGE